MTDFRFKGSIEIEGKSYRIKAKGKLEEKEPSEPPTEPPTEPERPPVDPPPSGQSVKPYGPYARFGQGDMSGYPGQGEWNKTDHPRCRGAVVIFMWRSLEQGEGDYNLTAIGAAMDECARRGIKLGVYIRDYAFSGPGDEPKNSHPDYVLNNPGRFGGRAGQGGLFLHSNKDFNNGKHTKGTNRYRTAFWIPEVTDRRVALLKAVFAYIDAHPNRNVVTFVNNAASTSGGSLRTSEWDDVPAHQYSPEKLRDEHLRYLDAVAPLRLPGGANFCFNGELIPESPTDKDGWQIYLRDIYDRCAEYQIGWCQPDPKKVKATFNGGELRQRNDLLWRTGAHVDLRPRRVRGECMVRSRQALWQR